MKLVAKEGVSVFFRRYWPYKIDWTLWILFTRLIVFCFMQLLHNLQYSDAVQVHMVNNGQESVEYSEYNLETMLNWTEQSLYFCHLTSQCDHNNDTLVNLLIAVVLIISIVLNTSRPFKRGGQVWNAKSAKILVDKNSFNNWVATRFPTRFAKRFAKRGWNRIAAPTKPILGVATSGLMYHVAIEEKFIFLLYKTTYRFVRRGSILGTLLTGQERSLGSVIVLVCS